MDERKKYSDEEMNAVIAKGEFRNKSRKEKYDAILKAYQELDIIETETKEINTLVKIVTIRYNIYGLVIGFDRD